MWWEILPPAAIMVVCLSLPQYAAWHWNQAVYGCHYRRKLESLFERNMFSRDYRITGAPWVLNDLDAIPDKEETKK